MAREADQVPAAEQAAGQPLERCRELEAELAALRSLFNALPTPIYTKDLSGSYLSCNPAFERLLGLAPGALRGRTAADVLDPERAGMMTAMDRRLLAAGDMEHVERTVVPASEEREVLVHKTLLAGAGGEPAGVVGVLTDVTALKRTESALRASETRYRALFDNLADAIVVYEIRGDGRGPRLIEANAAALGLLGFPRDEFFAMNTLELVRPADGVPVEAVWKRFLDEGRIRFTADLRTRDGRFVPVQINAHRFRHEGRDLGLSIIRNLTIRRAAEDARHKSEARFRAVFEHAGMGIVLAGTDGVVIEANQAFLDLLGYSLDELRAMHLSAYTHADDLKPNLALLAELKAGRRSGYQLEKRYRRKDGGTVWAALTVTAVPAENGVPLVLGIIEDITGRKEAEAERAALNERLEGLVARRTAELSAQAAELAAANALLREEDERKSAFLSAVSHELRTPLTSLLGFAKLIERDFGRHFAGQAEGVAPTDKARRILDNLGIITSEGERLTRLVADVLDLNRLESGQLTFSPRPVDLLDLIRRAARILGARLAGRPELALVLDLPESVALVAADPDRVLQVLLNLLDNALKFTEQGRITVSCQIADAGRSVRASVSDTGRGIPEAELTRIFERYHQVAKPGPGPASGAGLGLAISRLIAGRLGGRLWAESEPGRGSTFHLTLPVAEQPPG